MRFQISVHEALIEALGIEDWDRFQRIVEIDREELAKFIKRLDMCEHAANDSSYAPTTSYFVTDEHGRLIGAISLRHYLTVEGNII